MDRALQREVFTSQLSLALELQLPLILHIREAEKDGLSVLESAGVPPNYPIHR